MDSEIVKLVATVPGIELNIDPSSTYVLVDISPDYSLWPLPDDSISWSTREIQVGCWSAEGHVLLEYYVILRRISLKGT